MSVSLVLLPLAIALGAGAGTTAISSAAVAAAAVGSKTALAVAAEAHLRHLRHLRELYEKSQSDTLPPLETIFTDAVLLEKTLQEHGLRVAILSDDHLSCQIGAVSLDYSRQSGGGPFKVTVSGLQNIDDFFTEMECFEREYRQNVQSYTYDRLMKNIHASNMKVADETLLEDNSILLTIDV